MFRTTKLYTCMAVVLAVICVIFLVNCGGGGNSSVVPNTNPTTENPVSYTDPTPTPVLIQKPIQGYIYANNITTEDGETIPNINVLDVPACQADSSGNEPFVTQVSNSLQQDYPEDWAKADIQELYAQLNKTLSESKPLPEYNVQAQLCSAYDDTSIPVGNDGHFDNTVLTGATDSNVKLEVALGEDNYAEVETLPSSDNIISSDAVTAELKSCPEKIFAFPGEAVIFKVYSEPGINLKSAGLKFALNNSSIGCITQPVYLCLFGAHKYQVAYGCVYIKPGLDTPVDTVITAKTNTGQSMSIFLEVIKKTASVSGIVYTGGQPLIKGYVKSIGPKAFCKLDSSGFYTLPRVFCGHFRKIIATYWFEDNSGRKIRHREEKVIDYFNSNLTNFNFGEELLTPTPTLTPTATPTPRKPTDPYYDKISMKIIAQKWQWISELGEEEGVKKSVDWLNGNVLDLPIPEEVKNAISEARLDQDNPSRMWIYFKDGTRIRIIGTDPWFSSEEDISQKTEMYNKLKFPSINSTKKVSTVGTNKILILAPFAWQHYKSINSFYSELGNKLIETEAYQVKRVVTGIADTPGKPKENPDIKFSYIEPNNPNDPEYDPDIYEYIMRCSIVEPNNVVRVEDFNFNLAANNLADNYGVIYIDTHGFPEGLACGPVYDDEQLRNWLDNNKNFYDFSYVDFPQHYEAKEPNRPPGHDHNDDPKGPDHVVKVFALNEDFFVNRNLTNSIVYIAACSSWKFHENGNLNNAKVYLGNSIEAAPAWNTYIAYYFFHYLMYGYKKPIYLFPQEQQQQIPTPQPPFNPEIPMSVKKAVDILTEVGGNPDPRDYSTTPGLEDCQECVLKLDTQNGLYDETYFPVPVTVTVEKR